MASINNSQALSFIGKEVVTSGNNINFDGRNAANIDFNLNNKASNVNINIYDETGKFVDTISYGSMDSGEQSATWYGKDSNGNYMTEGNYSYEVYAADENKNKIGTASYSTGVVEGITFIEGVGYVLINDQKIPIGDIIEIRDKTETASNNAVNNPYELIGKDVIASGDKIYWDAENEPQVGYELAEDAANVSISVYDDNGKLMRTFESSGTDEGMNYAVWDGRRESEAGAVLPAGEYSFQINAYNAGGKAIEATTVVSGEVVGVNTEEGHTYLNVAGVKIPASDIIEVKQKGSLLNLVEGLGNTVKGIGDAVGRLAPFLL
jgi:flagellar hook assembly protein FlgD